MQEAEVVLSVLRERGREGLPLMQLYRQLFNKDAAASRLAGANQVTKGGK